MHRCSTRPPKKSASCCTSSRPVSCAPPRPTCWPGWDDPPSTRAGGLDELPERPHLRLVQSEPDAHELVHAEPVQPVHASPALTPLSELNLSWDDEDDIDQQDQVDADLFPIFEEEAQELLPQLANEVRHWLSRPEDTDAASASGEPR